MSNSTLSAKVQQLQTLLVNKDSLAEATKENNAAIQSCKESIIETMIDDDVTGIVYDGYSFNLALETKYSKRSEDELAAGGFDFMDTLREQGLGALIKETVDPRTLNSAIAEIVENNDGELPEDLAAVIKPYEFTDIKRRKASSKAAKAIKGGKIANE